MARANAVKRGCQVVRTKSGGSPFIIAFPEGRAAARSWTGTALARGVAASDTGTSTGYAKAGVFVYQNSTKGLDVFPGDGSATAFDADSKKIVGLLLENVTGTATNRVLIAAAHSDNIFETSIVSETATTTATVTASLIGARMQASLNASRFYLDRTASAPSVSAALPFLVVDVKDGDGTLNGRVQFVVRDTYSLWGL